MAKKTFETVLKWNGGEAFRAKVEVGADGWGRVFDTADGLYCGSMNPLRTRQLMQEAAYGKKGRFTDCAPQPAQCAPDGAKAAKSAG